MSGFPRAARARAAGAARFATLGRVDWQVGDEVWSSEVELECYVPALLGHVLYLGRRGFTVRRTRPDMYGSRELRLEYACPGIWRTRGEAEAWCTEHVGPWHRMQR